jgi:hypothetical protein
VPSSPEFARAERQEGRRDHDVGLTETRRQRRV